MDLFYDTDTNPASGLTPVAYDLDATGSYDWDCSLIQPGDYYIRAVASGGGSTASDYSDGTLTVDHSGGDPGMTVLTPPDCGDTADELYEITWVSSGFSDGMVDLYYDEDTDPDSGLVEIALDLTDSGSYNWDCSSVSEGYYYVYGEIDDSTGVRLVAWDYSDGTLAVDHGGLQPEITVTMPPAGGDTADNFYTIEWVSTAPAGSTVDLYYDTDTEPSTDLVTIGEDLNDDGYYNWNCENVAEGSYYIYGVITSPDGRKTALRRLPFLGDRGQGTDYSDGMLTIDHSNPYEITVTAPPPGGASADSSYTIQWTSNAPATELVDLFYAVDTTGAELYTLAEDVQNSGSYDWDCYAVEEGVYYIYAVIGEGKGLGSDWSDGTLTITHEQQYTFTITAPPEGGDTADESYQIEWEGDAPMQALVSLWYEDPEGPTLVLIVSGVLNTGAYLWDCSAVPEGSYYIYGVVSDDKAVSDPLRFDPLGTGSDWSDGQLTISHSTYSMEVTAPPAGGDTADSTYTIEWTATGGPSSVVGLYYDTDTDPSSGLEAIVDGLDNTGSYDWNTVSVPEGVYYVYAIIYDAIDGNPVSAGLAEGGSNDFAYDYSDGPLTISHEYFFLYVTAPPPWGAEAEEEYTIEWAAAASSGATVDLYYDTDTIPSGGLVEITTDLPWDQFAYTWDCSSVPEDTYYIYAVLTDGAEQITDYSDGTLTINRDPLFLWITEPNPGGATADDVYDIEWMSSGPTGRTIDLYYDTDTEPSSGLVEIILDLVTSSATDSYRWDCSAVPEGVYYIYGILRDPPPGTDSTTHYSEGTLTIEHP